MYVVCVAFEVVILGESLGVFYLVFILEDVASISARRDFVISSGGAF